MDEPSAGPESASSRLPVEYAVAIVLRNSSGEFLTVRRADDDVSLPGIWGLPAVSLKPGEDMKEAVIRAGRQKLGVDVEIKSLLGTGEITRDTYILNLSDYEVMLVNGTPSVPQPDRSVSQYTDLRFTDDPSILKESARRGSLCSRVFLETVGMSW